MLKNFLNRIRLGTTVTHEGGKAYTLTLEEKLIRLFTIGQLNGSFYLDTDTVIKQSAELLSQALAEAPEFASRAAVYAAEEMGMKALPTLWAVYLSTLPDKSLFRQVFPRVIRNPKMAHDFLTLARKGGIRQGMGQGVKRVINQWLETNLNPVWATRYAGKLEDLVRVTRPADTPATEAYLRYIIRPAVRENGRFTGYGPRRLAFERAQALHQVLEAFAANQVTPGTLGLIRAHRLQLEELKHAFGPLDQEGKQAVFAELIPGLFYHALVSNLVAIERAFATATRKESFIQMGQRFTQEVVISHGLPAEIIRTVADRLGETEAYRRSRMLPFGLITAAEMTSVPQWRAALSQVLESLGAESGLGEFPGVRALIGVDCSGSMQSPVTRSLSARAVASTFGAMLAMSLRAPRVYAVSEEAYPVAIDQGARLVDNARRIAERNLPAATYLGKLLQAYQGEQVVLLITDSQTADNPEDLWAGLRNRPDGARLIVWEVLSYQNKISNRPDVFYVSGFSDRVLGLVQSMITGTATQRDAIERVKV